MLTISVPERALYYNFFCTEFDQKLHLPLCLLSCLSYSYSKIGGNSLSTGEKYNCTKMRGKDLIKLEC